MQSLSASLRSASHVPDEPHKLNATQIGSGLSLSKLYKMVDSIIIPNVKKM